MLLIFCRKHTGSSILDSFRYWINIKFIYIFYFCSRQDEMSKNSRYCPFKTADNSVLFQLMQRFFRKCVQRFYRAVFRLLCRIFQTEYGTYLIQKKFATSCCVLIHLILLCLIFSFFLYLYSQWAVGFCKKMFAQFYLSTLIYMDKTCI